MPNFATSSLQATLFKSVIPSDIPWSPPVHGRGSPEGKQKGVPGQLYTQDDVSPALLWCKGTTAPTTGWFRVAANSGHPTVIAGNYYQTDPNGLVVKSGPAIWYGWDKSVWVKTDTTEDASNWKLLLEYSLSVGAPDAVGYAVDSNEEMEAP